MEQIRNKLITGALLIGWMVVIFCFSAQPAPESSKVSGTVAYRIVDTTDRMLQMELSVGQRISYAEILDYPIRKAAHMTEYAILGLLSFAFVTSMGKKGKVAYLMALGITVAYAATDEFHQLFVQGRSGRFMDVCIDTTGAVIGLLLLHFVLKMVGKHCEKQGIPLQ